MAEETKPAEKSDESASEERLERLVGLFVVVLATFLGVCNVKDGNIVQRMDRNQADRIDNFSWFQARKIRISVYESFAEQMSVPMPGETEEGTKLRLAKIEYFRNAAKKQGEESKKQLEDAEKAVEDYNKGNAMDDQFDISEAALAIGLALMGVTALMKRWLMFFIALVPSIFGLVMGIAGFAGIDTSNPVIEWIIKILS